MIEFQEVSYRIGGRPILERASFSIAEGARVGLLGPNGCGKTTLLRLLVGELLPDAGAVRLAAGRRLGYLAQHPSFPEGVTVLAHVAEEPPALGELRREVQAVEARMEREEDPARLDRLVERHRQLSAEWQGRGGFEHEGRAEATLRGLGIPPGLFGRELSSLSGGEKNRVALARILCQDPEVLVLDEPTNYLDVEMLEWLEEHLSSSPRTVVFSSHDRAFLDGVALYCFELREGRVFSYRGNYEAYALQREEEVARELQRAERLEAEVARELEFIRRNFYGQRARQAKSREKRVLRLREEEAAVPAPGPAAGPPRIRFDGTARGGDDVLRVEGADIGYPGRVLIGGADLELTRGERVALLGPNGCGKTTLLRTLAGDLAALGGRIKRGLRTLPARYDQECAAVESPRPLFDLVHDLVPRWENRRVRDLLAAFLFRGDRVQAPVSGLSGGEKARLALIRLVLSGANLLLLDEPTNHLDLHARAALEEALLAFPETIVFVSHDRYFIERVADRVLSIEGGALRELMGGYPEYRQLLARRRERQALDRSREREAERGRRREGRVASGRPSRRRTVDEEKLLAEIDALEGRLRAAEEEASRPEVCRSAEESRRVKREIEDLRERISLLYRKWEESI
jgi:ATP-binding cassette, subfamily F, member 3